MERSKAFAVYAALFRFIPLAIILFSAFLWSVAGDKVAIVAGALLFCADIAALIWLTVRSSKKRG